MWDGYLLDRCLTYTSLILKLPLYGIEKMFKQVLNFLGLWDSPLICGWSSV
jgi:hypothetical protein